MSDARLESPNAEAIATEADATAMVAPTTGGGTFLVCRGERGVEVVSLEPGQEVIVGRLPEATFRTDSPRVSRRHATLRLRETEILLTDHDSRNGTTINGKVIRGGTRVVGGGDVIGIGPLELVIARSDQAGSRAPVAEGGVDEEADDPVWRDGILIAEQSMVKLMEVVRRLAPTLSTVLVVGETGAGKEMVAERLHGYSARSAGPYLKLNCASLAESVIESELFGHEKGAFTGADRRRTGYFEAASGGTLLLDEIGEMPAGLQAKLLRALEQRKVTRLGGTQEVAFDVRIVCATNRDLLAEVEAGRFRRDLYYRISTFLLEVPPLRERPTELVLLANLFAAHFAGGLGLPKPSLEPQVVAALAGHPWPGNVRELRNAMEYAVVMADGPLVKAEHLPRNLRKTEAEAPAMRDRVGDLERAAIVEALAAEGGNRTRAAKRLQMSRRALIYKMIKYGLRE